jgi:hypothetical protein
MKEVNSMQEARLLVLDPKHERILSFNTDGADVKTIMEGCGPSPDGIVIDLSNRHIYWTNMGAMTPNTEHFAENDGSIERVDFDGANRKVIVPAGATFTPKQLTIDAVNGLIYWCDREGMRVMRVGTDGSNITTLIQTGSGDTDRLDETKHCVGITLDVRNGYFYWTQKGPHRGGQGRIFRAGLNAPEGADPKNRADVELLWDHLPEPIDLDFDHLTETLYWTDRGAAPKGNTLNRAKLSDEALPEPEILCGGLKEVIGLALDLENSMAYFVDLGGNIYRSRMDGSDFKLLYSGDGMYTGIVFVPGGQA